MFSASKIILLCITTHFIWRDIKIDQVNNENEKWGMMEGKNNCLTLLMRLSLM